MSMQDELQITIDRYHELLRLTPNDSGLVTNLAWSYERAKSYVEAIQGFRRALELNPNDYDAHFGLGLALMGIGDHTAARDELIRSKELARDNADRSTMAIISKQVESIARRMG